VDSTKDASEILEVDAGMLRVRLMRLRKRLRESNLLSGWV
jgi:DNA-directed RNA polymerase specialized sigma24 family protein